MNATKSRPAASPQKKRSSPPKLAGEVTYITVPRSPESSFNPDRPANALILAQVEHMHQAEKNRQHKGKLSGKHPDQIHTEREAASYIQVVTKLLHPEGRKKTSKRNKSTPPKGE